MIPGRGGEPPLAGAKNIIAVVEKTRIHVAVS